MKGPQVLSVLQAPFSRHLLSSVSVFFFSLCCQLSFTSLSLMKGNTLVWCQLMLMITMMTFTLFFYSFSCLFTDNPFPCPPTPSPIPNYSKKEKAWGRAHLPQMSDECVATRDPHSSPPPSALTVYRHPQSLTDDVSSHRFRFRYLRFGAILWTFFYFTDVFFYVRYWRIKKNRQIWSFQCVQNVVVVFCFHPLISPGGECRRWPSEW